MSGMRLTAVLIGLSVILSACGQGALAGSSVTGHSGGVQAGGAPGPGRSPVTGEATPSSGAASPAPDPSSTAPKASPAGPATPAGPASPQSSGSAVMPANVAGYPPGLSRGPLRGSMLTPGAVSAARPWAAKAPSGHGQLGQVDLPAPWRGGHRKTITVGIYLPPGYRHGTARYPVIYSVLHGLGYWQSGMGLTGVLDDLTRRGLIPPTIVIFTNVSYGPFRDTECADSLDGRQWIDRWTGSTLVRWVDRHFRTIAAPAARATIGFSQGGYCAGAAVAHHPAVFASAMVLSGYFVAGLASHTTPTAWIPFGGNAALMQAVSPITVIPTIPDALRANLFYELAADPASPVYGKQMRDFAAVLHGSGVPMALFPTSLGHSWAAARLIVPTMLRLWAGRMVALGVFGAPR